MSDLAIRNNVAQKSLDELEKSSKKEKQFDDSGDDYVAERKEAFSRVVSERVASAGPLRNIKDKKLKSQLKMDAEDMKLAADATVASMVMLQTADRGLMEPESADERTSEVRQRQLRSVLPAQAARKSFEVSLPASAPFRLDYTRNGRHLLLGGQGTRAASQLAIFDALKLRVSLDFDPLAPTRDVKFLHNRTMFAAAHSKYVHIYDQAGTELHVLKKHIDVRRLEFLPFHFLLASVGNAGYLKYQDVSTGELVAEWRTKLGSCAAMTQNPRSAVLSLGHSNGTVTLWSPNLSTPLAKILAHRGKLLDVTYDKTGNYLVTSASDSLVKIFDIRTFQPLTAFRTREPAAALDVSQLGLLAAGFGSFVHIYHHKSVFGSEAAESFAAPPRTSFSSSSSSSSYAESAFSRVAQTPEPYMTFKQKGQTIHCLRFAPYDDVLGVGHSSGFTSLLVPGAGEPNFDSFVASPFETKKQRKESEVRALLEKLPASMITLHGNVVGSIAEPVSAALKKKRAVQREANAKQRAVDKANRSATRNRSAGGNKIGRRMKRKQLLIVEHQKELSRKAMKKGDNVEEKEEHVKKRKVNNDPLDRFKKKKE